MANKKSPKPTPASTLLAQQLRALRLRQGIDQQTLALRAGIALNAVKKLEYGRNSTVRSLLLVLRALGREDWLNGLAPQVTVSPIDMLKRKTPRQRASRVNKHVRAADV